MASNLEILRRFLRESKRDALQEKWDLRRRERSQAEFRKKIQPTLITPPSVLLIERASWECPRCCNVVGDDTLYANVATCPHCAETWRIQAWFTPRKPGRTGTMARPILFSAMQWERLPHSDQVQLKPGEHLRTSYCGVDRAVFQCNECGHLMLVGRSFRNTWKCTRCKRHWEVTMRIEGLSVGTSSCENVSEDDQEAASQPIESLPESTPELFAI